MISISMVMPYININIIRNAISISLIFQYSVNYQYDAIEMKHKSSFMSAFPITDFFDSIKLGWRSANQS